MVVKSGTEETRLGRIMAVVALSRWRLVLGIRGMEFAGGVQLDIRRRRWQVERYNWRWEGSGKL
jgi:hypothetical protein